MNRFLRIFDVILFVVSVLYVLALVARLLSLIAPNEIITIDKTFMAYACLSIGLLIGVRGFFKPKPFYMFCETEWPKHWSVNLFFIALFTSLAMNDLAGQSLLNAAFWIFTFVITFFSTRVTRRQMREMGKAQKKQ